MNISERISINRSFAFRLSVLLVCFAAFAVSAFAQTASKKKSDQLPTRQAEWYFTKYGKFDCEDLNNWDNGTNRDSRFAHITTNNELRLLYAPPTTSDTVPYTTTGGTKPRLVIGTAEEDPTSYLTTDANDSQTSFTWRSDKAIAAVIVEGESNYTRIYYMPEGAALGSVFQNPANTPYSTADGSKIRKLGFCYHQPGNVTIIKRVLTNGGISTIAFPFTWRYFTGATQTSSFTFSLMDNNVEGPDRLVKNKLYDFLKFNRTITVTEGTTTGWTLSDITCTETGGTANTTTSLTDRRATIKLEEGERVTCTFGNTNLSPSAAGVTVSGRVVRADGRGVANALVVITNAATGVANVAYTNPFGYYVFSDIESGNLYVMSVMHKSYKFTDSQRSFSLNDTLEMSDFVADPEQ